MRVFVEETYMSPAPLRFLRSYLSQPGAVGAVTPSSPQLAAMMVRDFDLTAAKVVVELGPGTGAFTGTILERVGAETRFIAVEREAGFVTHLRTRFPTVDLVHGSAGSTLEILAERGLDGADFIISGLPWASFDPITQGSLLQAVHGSLRPGGCFSTFAYIGAASLPRGRRFRKLLESRFTDLRLTPVVWRNFPPAFVYLSIR